ncbi:MAG: SHOCT domain-containing protein [Nitrosopumilaceae archaeon]|nr:SHOCT domain-containing protein [Nitrosopumilaceae archaeon]NIU00624.1 SHOCT domain-containing protein [Nitrosopumilaceae archaeon]NIU87010.1 SHOCT domain-containing protein [Nitrosopumilaceae archaeon]NIV66474.1 SHOCT domain-containing protein [Nitrosopumilaceae archaeon]NIX61226.1 SHOCT domain-containing protein [Nitrosopumilaceae archaeon]
MATKKKKERGGYIEKFLNRANKAVDEGVKRADEILDEAVEFGVLASGQAKKTSKELRQQAKRESQALKTESLKKIDDSLTAARRFGTSVDQDLSTLERLGKLKKSGVITQKEFEEKKKKILSRL